MKYLFILILAVLLVSCENDSKFNTSIVTTVEQNGNRRECRVEFPSVSGGLDVYITVWISPCIFSAGDTLKLVKQ